MKPSPLLHGCGSPSHALNRRMFLGTGTGLLLGGTAGLNILGTSSIAENLKQSQKRAILIFLGGGHSQFETWDPKVGAATGGPFMQIPTTVPGYHVCELMPEMSQRIHKHTAVIRSIDTNNTDHARGAERLLRGNRPDDGPARFPTLGAMLARELAQQESRVPDHVALYTTELNYPGKLNPVPDFSGCLGSRWEAINILRDTSPECNKLPNSLTDLDHKQRADLRALLSQKFAVGRGNNATLRSHLDAYGQVRGLMASDTLFDISREPQRVRDRYGPTMFGRQALCARRLVEAGVPFIRLNRGWWDSHGENFDIHHELVPELDYVLAVLLDDLEERGLLDHTLVITMAEMGRTPKINSMRGRDHYAGMSATLSGCGIQGGVIYGSTNDTGTEIIDGKVNIPQFFATIFDALGLDHQKKYNAGDGRPITLVEYDTESIPEVLA